MSKKRGLSLEEKCDRAYDYILSKRTFFHMKELEKSLPKAKGITPMAIKEVIQTLVDDDRILTEKVFILEHILWEYLLREKMFFNFKIPCKRQKKIRPCFRK